MTTGRINQVAIRVALEAVTSRPRRPCDRRAQPISQLARVIVHHHRQLSDVAAAADGPRHRLGPTDGRTALFTARLPITRFEVGIRKTVKVQIPNCYSTDTSLETATARKRYRCSAFVGHRDPMCLDRALTSSPHAEVRVHRDGVLKPSRHWHNQTCRFASHSRRPAAISCLSL